jgi:hypothetical protein
MMINESTIIGLVVCYSYATTTISTVKIHNDKLMLVWNVEGCVPATGGALLLQADAPKLS